MHSSQRTIVIIGNSPEGRDLFRPYLLEDRRYRYQIWNSEHGEGGWQLCQQVKPDAILLDARFLDAKGIELWQQGYARCQERRDCPATIALRDSRQYEEMTIAVEDCLFEEEVTPALFRHVLDDALERQQLQRELTRSRAARTLNAEILRNLGTGMSVTEMLAGIAARSRQLLDCDRISIYQFAGGTVVAESVATDGLSLVPALQNRAEAPCCLTAMAGNGRESCAIADADESGLSQSVREWCDRLHIKASLSTPIIFPSELSQPWGLLVAHQCRQTRNWQSEECELLEDVARHLAISLERAQLLENAQRERETETLLHRERQQLEDRLRALDERCNLAAETIRSVIYDWDIEIDRVERAAGDCPFLGCRMENAEMTRHWWNQRIHPDDLARVREEVKEVFLPGDTINYTVEYRIRHENGQYIGVRDRGIVLRDERHIPKRAVGTVRELDNSQETRTRLERPKEDHLLQSCFVSMVSHEFRNPLNSISGIAQMLELYDTRLPAAKKQELFKRLQQGIERMIQLLDEVLLVGRADAGKLEFKPARLNLEKLCRGAIAEVYIEDLESTKIELIYRGEKEANVDENLLRHILVNLLSNAIKYSPEKKSIQFEVVCDASGILLKITDSGIGIPLEDRHHLFGTFHRASNVGTIKGTGLGLAIVKQCVDLHGGQIEVASEIGRGTTFTIRLPDS